MKAPQIKVRQEKKAFRQIIETILVMIADGSLQYGSNLYTEQELCQLLGVSRPTLREALRAMEILGIVTVRPRKGIMINYPDYEGTYLPLSYILSFEKTSAQELFEMRGAIQLEMAWKAALNRTEEQAETIMNMVAQAERSFDTHVDEFNRLDEEFHQYVAFCAGNMFAYKFMVTLSSIIQKHMKDASTQALSAERRKVTLAHHREIAERIVARDPAGAQAMTRVHLIRTLNMIPKDATVHYSIGKE